MEYTLPPTQVAVNSSQMVEVPCVTSLPRSDMTGLDFRIDKSDLLLDPTNVYLYVKCRIDKIEPVDEAVDVFPSNILSYSMWENVQVYIQDQKFPRTIFCMAGCHTLFL